MVRNHAINKQTWFIFNRLIKVSTSHNKWSRRSGYKIKRDFDKIYMFCKTFFRIDICNNLFDVLKL